MQRADRDHPRIAVALVDKRIRFGISRRRQPGWRCAGYYRRWTLANTEISLSTADFELLWELATHAGQIMDRDALLKNLRGVSYDGLDRSVDVAISRLRKKLLDNAAEPYRIKTVRNKGYLFAPHAWE